MIEVYKLNDVSISKQCPLYYIFYIGADYFQYNHSDSVKEILRPLGDYNHKSITDVCMWKTVKSYKAYTKILECETREELKEHFVEYLIWFKYIENYQREI